MTLTIPAIPHIGFLRAGARPASAERVHRRAPRGVRGRADLRGVAGRPSTSDSPSWNAAGGRHADTARPRGVGEIRRVHDASGELYDARKVGWQLTPDGIRVARCTVQRLMRHGGREG